MSATTFRVVLHHDAVAEVRAILAAERLRRDRQLDLSDFVQAISATE